MMTTVDEFICMLFSLYFDLTVHNELFQTGYNFQIKSFQKMAFWFGTFHILGLDCHELIIKTFPLPQTFFESIYLFFKLV